MEPVIGMKCCKHDELKNCLRSYAVKHGYPIKFQENESKRLLAICVNGCPWRLWATYMQTEDSFQIKSYNSIHKCIRNFKLRLINSKWLANEYHTKFINNPRWKLRDIKADVLERYSIDVSLSVCHRAKKSALGELEKSLKDHYAKLWNYGAEILRSNPGSTMKITVDRPDPNGPAYFQRMYVCLNAVKEGWLQGCRPIIGMDGCFLKGYCDGELLTAVGRDGNNQMFPIAWAVVEVESKDSWSWFLTLLTGDIGLIEGNGWTLITDQQKGLVPTIKELLPLAEHRMCARHIYSNFRKQHTGVELKSFFWQAAKSGTPEEFELVMAEIKNVKKEAFSYLIDHNPLQWSRAFFSNYLTCEAVENNICECFNACIVEARRKPIISMLEDIRLSTMVRMQQKREAAQKWEDVICPRVRAKLEENKDNHRFWQCIYNGDLKFKVNHGEDGYTVDLKNRTYACRMWDLSGVPCCHAIAAIYYIKDDPDHYVSGWFYIEEYKKSYKYFLQPLNRDKLWPKIELQPFLPPPSRRMPGRPRKNRIKKVHESPKKGKSHQLSRKGRKMRCQNCMQFGHNKKTCRNPTITKPQKLPVKRKAPNSSSDPTVQTVSKNAPSTSTGPEQQRRRIKFLVDMECSFPLNLEKHSTVAELTKQFKLVVKAQ